MAGFRAHLYAFELATATRILFGEGSVHQAAPARKEMGSRPLLVTGISGEHRAGPLRKELAAAELLDILWIAPGEPSIDLVREGVLALFAVHNHLEGIFGVGQRIRGRALAIGQIQIDRTKPGGVQNKDFAGDRGLLRPIRDPRVPRWATA